MGRPPGPGVFPIFKLSIAVDIASQLFSLSKYTLSPSGTTGKFIPFKKLFNSNLLLPNYKVPHKLF